MEERKYGADEEPTKEPWEGPGNTVERLAWLQMGCPGEEEYINRKWVPCYRDRLDELKDC